MFADQGKVVVEVQRKCGCSYQFREAARAVLRSAKGVTAELPKRTFTIPSCIPRENPEEQLQRAEEGLEVAMKQLGASQMDSQLIGMESLEQITRCECRALISRKVLEGSCLEKVLAAAQDDSANARSDMEEQHINVMKRRALAVLANALSALSAEGKLADVLRSTPELKSDTLVSFLVDEVRECVSAPHEATQAARCLQYLMSEKEVEDILVEMSAVSVVSAACTSGARRSSLLEQECRKLKMQFSSV